MNFLSLSKNMPWAPQVANNWPIFIWATTSFYIIWKVWTWQERYKIFEAHEIPTNIYDSDSKMI